MEQEQPSINLVPVGTESSGPQLYRLDSRIANRLRDLFMHKTDLGQIEVWLAELLARHPIGSPSALTPLDEALWTASIVVFFRCFTPSARSHLDARRVFSDEPDGAIQAYDRLSAYRNRAIAHDQNFFNQAFIGVPVLNTEGPVARVGPVQIIQLKALTFDAEEISNLNNLRQAAIRWIDAESSRLNTSLDSEIAKMSRAEIIAHGPIQWTSPSRETANHSRAKR